MIRKLNVVEGPVAHIRYRGTSMAVPLSVLRVGAASSDAEVRRALARHLEVGENELIGHVLERHAGGNVTFRPEAVFG
jgi:hypothetical protein